MRLILSYLCLCLWCVFPWTSFAQDVSCAQNLLIYQGDTLVMQDSRPLDSYLRHFTAGKHAFSYHMATDHYTGYRALWALHQGKLYLQSLSGCGGKRLDLSALFGTASRQVQAYWYEGELRVPRGMGQGCEQPTHAKAEEVLLLKRGIVQDISRAVNYVDLPEGHSRQCPEEVKQQLLEALRRHMPWQQVEQVARPLAICLYIDVNGQLKGIHAEQSTAYDKALAQVGKHLHQWDLLRWDGLKVSARYRVEVLLDAPAKRVEALPQPVAQPY